LPQVLVAATTGLGLGERGLSVQPCRDDGRRGGRGRGPAPETQSWSLAGGPPPSLAGGLPQRHLGKASGYCNVHACGCPPHYKAPWCNPHNARIKETWCEASSSNCNNHCGIWCPSPPPPDLRSGLNVWPIPRGVENASGLSLALSPGFAVHYSGSSAIAKEAALRYTALIQRKLKQLAPAARGSNLLRTLELTTLSADDRLTNWTVNESYVLTVQAGAATLRAPTPIGGLRGLETFYQLLPVAEVRGCKKVCTNDACKGSRNNPIPTGMQWVVKEHASSSGCCFLRLGKCDLCCPPPPPGALPHDTITIVDAPEFAHRSLMIDAGRRLYPLPLVRSIIDAMAMTKLNVLHLHLSDMGRIAWESKLFPELNVGYDTDTRFWKQTEIRALIRFAKMRGVRVIPELEMSAHAKALLPLVKTQGLRFCNESFPVMLFNDPAGKTFRVLKRLITELAGLFEDEVLHVGMDEAQCHYSLQSSKDPLDVGMCGLQTPPKCNQQTTRELQHKLLRWAATKLNPQRRPMAWHNAYTDCGDLGGCGLPGAPPPATQGIPSTIVEVFGGSTIGTACLSGPELLANVTKAGFTAVMADAARLYLDTGSPNPSTYRKLLWGDIAAGLPAGGAQRSRVMGGALSLWSDAYCSGKVECGGWAYCPGAPWPQDALFPTGYAADTCISGVGWMQSSEQDAAFTQSAGGLLFPRANFGAGAFWNYRADVGADGIEVLRRTGALAASMAERGVLGLCPPGCSCSFSDRCGVPSPPPPPAAPAAAAAPPPPPIAATAAAAAASSAAAPVSPGAPSRMNVSRSVGLRISSSTSSSGRPSTTSPLTSTT